MPSMPIPPGDPRAVKIHLATSTHLHKRGESSQILIKSLKTLLVLIVSRIKERYSKRSADAGQSC